MVALFSEVHADYGSVCCLQAAVPVQTDEDNKHSNTLPFILRLAGKQLVEILDQTVIAFLPFQNRSKFKCTRKRVFFGEVHREQLSFFESKHIDCKINVVPLLKLWDFTDRYRTLNTIQVDCAKIELSVNSLRLGFAENWVCGHQDAPHETLVILAFNTNNGFLVL